MDIETNNNEIVEELKGFKKIRKFLIGLSIVMIVNAIVGIVTTVISGSAEVWEVVCLWISSIMTDCIFLIWFIRIKTITIGRRKENN